MSLGTTALGSEREREVREGLGPTPNTAWAVRIHSREAGWGFSGWKITKRNIKGKGGVWLNLRILTGFLIKTGQVIRHQEFFLKLDFMKKCTDGLRRSFSDLTKVWSSKESLSPPLTSCLENNGDAIKSKN